VNEFSQFVRFPTAKLQPTDTNVTVGEAVEVFSGRLDGIQIKTSLEQNLPAIRADGPLLRSVIINLIDNAAEALEGAPCREITVGTHLRSESDTIEIAVADTGHGISPEDKDRLFLPHFSTKERGTGLGLAIAARIISEHGGSLRVEDNAPVGSRFLIELPVAETPAAPATERVGIDTDR
jgi:signal transduction histidine kinase